MANKKITAKLTITIDIDDWAAEYGCDRRDVPTNVKNYIQNALYTMPIEPESVEVK